MKDKSIIFIGVGFGIIILALIVLLILTYTTDIFKPASESFQEYLSSDIEQINKIVDVSKENEYINILKQSNYRDNTTIKASYKNSQGKTEEFKVISTGITNNSNNNSYRKINIKYGESFDVMNVDFLQENQTYGLLFSDVVNQFVSANITDFYDFFTNIGIDISEIKKYKIPEIWDMVSNKKENLMKIFDDNIKEIEKEQYSIQKNKEITLDNGQSQITTAYILTLTSEQTSKLLLDILRELNQTDLINQINTSKKEFTQTRITINVLNKKTSRIIIELENKELIIDFNDDELNIKYSNITSENIDSTSINIKKLDGKKYLKCTNNSQSIILVFDNNIEGTNAIANLEVSYKDANIQGLELSLQQTIETSNSNLEIEKKYTNENNVNISNLDNTSLNSALNALLTRIDSKLVSVNNQIYSEVINKWLEQNKKLENIYQGNKESEKQQFNNLFMGYKGENVDKNILYNLLDLVSRNILKYEVRGDEAVRIYIEQGRSNIQMTNEIKKIVEKSDKNFKVDFQYNAEGKLNMIIIEKIKDES